MPTTMPPHQSPELDDHERLLALQEQLEAEHDGNQGFHAAVILLGLVSALVIAVVMILVFKGTGGETVVKQTAGAAATAPADLGSDAGIKFEKFERVDPTLPPTPKGAVKKFKVDVLEHVTRVADKAPATRVWTYAINGVEYRGTAASPPMVVTQGDKVEINLVNGSSKAMKVTLPHSIDYHSSEIAPNKAFKSVGPGGKHTFKFTAKHPGVFMYHCATDPVLLHTGAGMSGMMIVKPKNLAPVDKELWITQQEWYLGKPGQNPSQSKMEAKQPDVMSFNGYAAQYKAAPIPVKKGEKVRMYVLNAGPSVWSAFHVIGTVFDKTYVEGTEGKSAQTINLAPSQGGWVEFTLDDEGTFPFVTHAFGDMVKGAVGVLKTEHAAGGPGH